MEEKVRLFEYIVTSHEKVLAWDTSKWRAFKEKYFSPIKFPTIDYKSWVCRNILITPRIFSKVVDIFQEKVEVGAIELSNALYCCV